MKYVAPMIAAALVIVGALYWLVDQPGTDVGDTSDPAVEDASGEASTAGQQAGRIGVPNAPAATPLWSVADEADANPLPPFAPKWSTAGRVLVRVTGAVNAAGGWRVGDRVTLPLPQLDVVYQPRIERLDTGPGPSISALGKVLGDDGTLRRFVVTVGPVHVFAYVDTPRGPYELSGGREFGWLLPSSSMMAGFDFSEPDYILPDRPGARAIPYDEAAR